MAENKVIRGELDIFYKNSKEQYLHMPFNNLVQDGKDLVVRSMEGLCEICSFTIHESDILKVDISKRKREAIFYTPRFYMIMTAL